MVRADVWLDLFTGSRYTCGPAWTAAVRRHLAAQIGALARGRQAADAVARFWRVRYYDALFPLRFGGGATLGQSALPVAAAIDLDALAGGALRSSARDAGALPPILPDPARGDQGWLLADRLLIQAALLNLILAADPTVSAEQRQAARLAALTYPFHDLLPEAVLGASGPLVTAIGAALRGEAAELPAGLAAAVQAVRAAEVRGRQVRLVLVAAQRIKQYVFDTPGLNEIRGGSRLLDQITDDLCARVERQIGPEVVLRAAGSTLMFLAPANDETDWPAELRRAFYTRTGSAFPTAAAILVDAQDLLDSYGDTVRRLFAQVEIDRSQAARPDDALQPFEMRCVLCGTRAAEGWDTAPDDIADLPQNRRPLCRVCKTKRQAGIDERPRRTEQLLRQLNLGEPPSLAQLGVREGSIDERVARELGDLIPSSVRRRLIGVVYGDGNNFGAVSQGLHEIALGVQWAARVRATSTVAAAVALAQAMRHITGADGPFRGRVALDYLPFQPLALGGDDVSLFAWAPIALRFAAAFAALTDQEFAIADGAEARYPRLSFALGVLVTDEKTPVRKSVDFTEEQLLKWAKQIARADPRSGGRIALLFAPTAEGIPADLEDYQKQIYRLGGRDLQLYTTLRPFTASELDKLLGIATTLVRDGDVGRVQRLAAAIYNQRQGVLAGLLHYAYQRGREGRGGAGGWTQKLEGALAGAFEPRADSQLFYAIARAPAALPAPRQATARVRQSPLWDLVELVKILS